MDTDIEAFFAGHPEALPIYERLEAAVRCIEPTVQLRLSKTQISFCNRYGFAFVSFAPMLPKELRPPVWLCLSFGLGYHKENERIAQAAEAYPGRWTHHMLLSSPQDVDRELISWLEEAASFSSLKGRRRQR